jgi:hypothetical protein
LEYPGKGLRLLKGKQGANQQLCPGLTIGTVLQVQVEGLGHVLSSLVGMEDELHLIIKTPLMADIATKLFQKNIIIVRYCYAGQVFGFRSTLLGMVKEPFRLCILSYPTKTETLNLRKHDRICCMLPAEIKMSQGLYDGLIEDISIGGCYFEFNSPEDGKFPSMKISDEALLSFDLPESEERVVLDIIVRAIKCDIRTLKLGVEFRESLDVDIHSPVYAAINSYIAGFR